MLHRSAIPLLLAVLLAAAAAPLSAQPRAAGGPLPSIEEKTDGLFPLCGDERSGQLWLEVPRFNTEFLHNTGYGAGPGSNDMGIDRGALGGARIVVFEHAGPKVLLVTPNYRFRSVTSTEPATLRGGRDAFARSVLWGFTAAAETGGRVLVEATEFLVRDVLNVEQRLRQIQPSSTSSAACPGCRPKWCLQRSPSLPIPYPGVGR